MLITLTTWVDRANRVLTVIASSVIAFICVSTLADTVGRGLRRPIYGLFELSELLLVAVVFFGLGAAQWTGSHVAVDVVSRSLSRRVGLVLEVVTLVLAIVITTVLAYGSTLQALRSWAIREFAAGAAAFPLYWSKTIIPIGCAYLGFVLAVQLAGRINHLRGHPPTKTLQDEAKLPIDV